MEHKLEEHLACGSIIVKYEQVTQYVRKVCKTPNTFYIYLIPL